MKSAAAGFLFALLVLVVQNGSRAEAIKPDEIAYQNYAFKQWFDTTLVWRFDRLPQKAIVEKHRLPYSGAIYPDQRGGTLAVLEKYDGAFHGGSRRASAFEWEDISTRGMPDWAGHCNGWTAAAIRHAEPQNSVLRNGVEFSPSDIKALLAELYVYSDSEFLGGVDPAINPGTLHVVITNWVGRGQHPIGMETSVGEEVWNYPVFGFAFSSLERDPRHVEVKINVGYVDFVQEEADEAPKRFGHRHFHYMLELSEDGEIIGGTYLDDSDRIDMLWVPLEPTPGSAPGNEDGNPYLDPETVLAMWRESTPAEARANWYVVDPASEDAVVEKPWFTIDPSPETTSLEPTLAEEDQRDMRLYSLETAEAPVRNHAPVALEDRIATDLQPPAPDELQQIAGIDQSHTDATPVDFTRRSTGDFVAQPEMPTPPDAVGGQQLGQEIAEQDIQDAKEVFREHFSDGSVKTEREVSLDDEFNYVNDGWYRQWDEEGTLVAEGRFEHGRRVGVWKRLHWTAEAEHFAHVPYKHFEEPFLSEAEFVDGRLHGTWTMKDAQDRPVYEIDFVDGKRHGRHVDWFPSGSKMREIEFSEGVIDGVGRAYSEDGELSAEETYVAGRRRSLQIETYVSTKKRSEKHLLLPRTVVDTEDDWWTGSPATFRTDQGEPLQHGPMKTWYENGQERFCGAFREGQAIGKFQWWRDNGQLCQQGTYSDGQQHGQWYWWHPNGGKAAVGNYDYGVPVGRWIWWSSTGQLDDVKQFQRPSVSFGPDAPASPPAVVHEPAVQEPPSREPPPRANAVRWSGTLRR